MRIIVDTNIAFSAILKSNSLIAQIILQPKSRLNFYSTELLNREIYDHRLKLKKLSGSSDFELNRSTSLIINRIKFIDAHLIPPKIFLNSEKLLKDIDIDDTEFVALTNYMNTKLWSGDKLLKKGLAKKNWKKFITTEELYRLTLKHR